MSPIAWYQLVFTFRSVVSRFGSETVTCYEMSRKIEKIALANSPALLRLGVTLDKLYLLEMVLLKLMMLVL